MRPTERREGAGAGRGPGTVVGVAGIMGAGKSTVARVFERLGAVRIDADELGRALLGSGAVKGAIIDAFGEGVLGPGGEVDRTRLGDAAFADEACAARLNRITRGPLVSAIMERMERLRRSNRVVVVDAALLPEWGGHAWVDFLIVVDSDEEACVSRMVKHSRFREGAVRARMACQLSREDKKRYADLVIINDGTQEELIQKAEQAYETVLGLGERSQ
jgi:dephospho-CoA kinase